MLFLSDNATPLCPAALAALAEADRPDAPYNGDQWSRALDQAFSDLFDTPVSALWVPSGTAANGIALACLCPPWGAIICHETAHVEMDEGGAPGFFTHGAKLLPTPGPGGKLTPDAIAARLSGIVDHVHHVPARAITITNATEAGQVYTAAEVAAIGALARERGLRLHMDGARFANAVAHLGCAPADISWRAGVDALTFGFAKNGTMAGEALLFFTPEMREAWAGEAVRWRKRSGHLLSKGRYMAAQMLALLRDDLWIANGRAANAAATLLAQAVPDRLVHPVQANELFVAMTPAEAAVLRAQGFAFYDWSPGVVRLVTNWSHGPEDVAPLARALQALGNG